MLVVDNYTLPQRCVIEKDELVKYYPRTSTDGKEYKYDRMSPIIFIGGVPRSGTTLLRAMIESHKDVQCGEETRVIPTMFDFVAVVKEFLNNKKRWPRRLLYEGYEDEFPDFKNGSLLHAVTQFVMEVLVNKHSTPPPILCNKDPFTMLKFDLVNDAFPNAKHIYIIRDGRASVQSMIDRRVGVSGFNLSDFRQSMTQWNKLSEFMIIHCVRNKRQCLPIRYENLVLRPRSTMKIILKFLDLEWDESVLNHDKQINKDVSLSSKEMSTDQVNTIITFNYHKGCRLVFFLSRER